MGKLFFKKHGACFSKAGMELECFRENMRGLAVAVERACSFKVIHQLVAESRVGDIVNDNLRSFFRGKTADIRYTLFGNEYMGVMFGVINMRTHRNNGRDSTSLATLWQKKQDRAPLRAKSPEPPMPFISLVPVT